MGWMQTLDGYSSIKLAFRTTTEKNIIIRPVVVVGSLCRWDLEHLTSSFHLCWRRAKWSLMRSVWWTRGLGADHFDPVQTTANILQLECSPLSWLIPSCDFSVLTVSLSLRSPSAIDAVSSPYWQRHGYGGKSIPLYQMAVDSTSRFFYPFKGLRLFGV